MCGIIAVLLANENEMVNQMLYDGLTVLQHRGQDAAGIMTCFQGQLHLRKENGLVKDVFQQEHMLRLLGSWGIGHTRYPTAGSSSSSEAQPFYTNSPYGIALAHNGNLTNKVELVHQLRDQNFRHVNTDSDSELLLNVLADELIKQNHHHPKISLDVDGIFDAICGLYKRCRGGFAAVSIINGYGILAFRDPNGIRPLILGSRCTTSQHGKLDYALASESVALDALNFTLVRDIAPGEAVFITLKNELHSRVCVKNATLSPCIFEHVYFARPDSYLDGVSVYQARLNMGTKLARKILREHKEDQIDVVIPIPDTSRTSALQVALIMGIPYREGFVKNRYIARTFIMPGQKARKKTVRMKLNAIKSEFKNKRVLLVDDSIVRGTTSRQIVQIARESEAKSVYFASAAPAIRHPNVYGIDMPSREELIAHGKTEREIATAIGADWVTYQDLEDLQDAVREENEALDTFDTSCFSGKYVTGDVDESYFKALEQERNDATMALKNHLISSSYQRDFCRSFSTGSSPRGDNETIDMYNDTTQKHVSYFSTKLI